ncbi:MAG: 50S ribosomal protein L17 [Anaerolineae bacterium]|nr:50S ribosomal protein L17 [Anaerolineae bacterium]
MRHRVAGRHLSRDSAQRRALFRNLMTELFRHERIRTTKAKALAIRADAEKLVTIAKHGTTKREAEENDVHERRLVAAVLTDPAITKKLFDDIAPRFMQRPGGYTRMLSLGKRQGDAADMVILELVK